MVVEPGNLGLRRQDNGHALMDGGKQRIHRGRHNSAGRQGCTSGVMPGIPQSSKGKRWLSVESHIHGRFGRAVLLPFKEAISEYQTTSPLQGLPKARFLCYGFHARIDHAVTNTGIFGPGGHQAPTEVPRAVARTIVHHSQYLLARSNVIRGRIRESHRIKMKTFCQECEIGSQGKTTTHDKTLWSCL